MFSCILFVIYINNFTGDYFIKPFLNTQYISIDLWSFIHIFFTLSLVIFNKKYRSLSKYIFTIVGWEFVENIICPNLIPKLSYFKETKQNIVSDLIMAIPGIYFIYNKRFHNWVDIKMNSVFNFNIA